MSAPARERAAAGRGGVEYGLRHFPVMIALHVALLAGCVLEPLLGHRTFIPALGFPMLALTVLANGLRWWCIATLGERWTARVIVSALRAAGALRTLPVVRAPELRRGHRRGRRAAADRVGVDHGVRVHGAQRRPADRAHPVRDPGACRRRAEGLSAASATP